ncbi:F-box protein CPR1-like [Rutidosis leptorrhynchoides]|uniref:F-box protein CPR1-like n=1 Tax=Rutidosis leptorrhynchoides TaxID=125765 RepID=UPI003A9A41B8
MWDRFAPQHSTISYLIPFHQFGEEEAVPVEFRTKWPYFRPVYHGSCNAFVLMSLYCQDYVRRMLVILNPTTREYVELPKCDYGSGIMHSRYNIGFFYDAETDDYKVVTIFRVHRSSNIHTGCIYVDVYSLRTNTWTRGPNDLPIIVAFCLSNEKFSEVPLPNDVGILSKYEFKLYTFDGKLSIFRGVEIWLMKEYGVKESWTKIILHGLDETPISVHQPKIFNYNGKVLLVNNDQMLMYDIEEGKLCKHIYASQNLRGLQINVICVESLVSLKSSGAS